MSAPAAPLIRGPPPSPPQSTDGEPVSTPESCALYPSVYSAQGAFAGAGLRAPSEVSRATSFDGQNAQPMYPPPAEYAQSLPAQHSMIANALQVNTPPPCDDSLTSVSGSPESTARWPLRSKARVSRSPRMRRRAQKNRDKDARPLVQSLPGPLSELTKHMTHIPIKDMERWVNRPTHVRHQEVVKRNGKVARPMNSFMLYRSAYAERTKEWFSQNNHQIVSAAAGDSWKIERPEIKRKYERLASIEKDNHNKAHPGYKFTPSKDKKKRPGLDDDSSFHGNTPDSSPALLHANSFNSTPEIDSNGWGSGHSTPFDMMDHGLPNDYFGDGWPTSNPGRPLSGMMLSPDMSQYIQPSANAGLMGLNLEDPRLKKSGLEDIQYGSSTTLAGLPGAAHHDLLQPQTGIPTPDSYPGGQLDPQLLAIPGGPSNPDGGSQTYPGTQYFMWQESSPGNYYLPVTSSTSGPVPYTTASSLQPGAQTLLDGRDAWDPSQETGLDAAGGEFDSWINQPPSGY